MDADERFFVDTRSCFTPPTQPIPSSSLPRGYGANRAFGARRWIPKLAGAHESYVNAVRKFRVPAPKARATVEVFASWQPIETGFGLIQRARHWTDEAQLTYWDGLIVAAAEQAGCAWLLSEDFQVGRKLGRVTVVNPFHDRPEQFGLEPNSR